MKTVPRNEKRHAMSETGTLRELENRIVIIETELRHLATKAWVLGGVVGGMVLAATVALAVARLFP